MDIFLCINKGKKFEHFEIKERFIEELTKPYPGQRQLFVTTTRVPETLYDEETFFELLKWAVTEVLNREKAKKPYTDGIKEMKRAREV